MTMTAAVATEVLRVSHLATAAAALNEISTGEPSQDLDELVVSSLAFLPRLSEPVDASADATPGTARECLEQIGELIEGWPSQVCTQHPDWAGFYSTFLAALGQARHAS